MAKDDIKKYKFTSETAREAGSKGGKASQQKKKAKKTIKEYLEAYMEAKPSPEKIQKLEKEGFNTQDITNYSLMIASLIKEAQNGDTRAIKLICEISEQGTAQALEIKKLKEEIKKLKLEQERLKLQTGEGATFEDLSTLAEMLKLTPEEEASDI